MRERAQRIGATVKVDSSPGHGCSVVLELPRTRDEVTDARAEGAMT